MIPQFLRQLLTASGRIPYTLDWPAVPAPPAIEIDFGRGSIGPLALGDQIEAARVLGQPDEYVRHEGNGCGLAYHRRGYLLEFDDFRKLSFACFFISPDPTGQDRNISHRPVSIKGQAPLTPGTGEQDVRSAFGKAASEGRDSDGSLLTFELNGLLLDFSFSPAGALTEFTLAKS